MLHLDDEEGWRLSLSKEQLPAPWKAYTSLVTMGLAGPTQP